MADYRALEQLLTTTLHLTWRPIAVTFCDTPPAGVTKFAGTEPSGCSFWKLAADGRAFYTVPSDHYNCPIGSYTHNIPLPPGREQELPQTLSLMSDIGYLRMEEVPSMSLVSSTPGAIVYSPLAATPTDPSVVIVTGQPAGLMLLHEAATRSHVPMQPLFGRPTCMAIAVAMTNVLANSFGCVGNRVYTDLPAGEMYSVISGNDLQKITDALKTIGSANATLRQYHEERVTTLRT
jgi:uncharacterized protein (DUF169 family)